MLAVQFNGYTQKITPEKVPATVKQAFATKFPAATDVNYVLKQKCYEVTCKDKGIGTSANFNATGKWLKTATAITESDLPKEFPLLLPRTLLVSRFQK